MNTLGVGHADIEVLGETFNIADNNKDRLGRPVFTPAQRTECLEFCSKVGRIKSPWANAKENIVLTKKREIWHEATRVAVDGGEAQIFGYTHRLKDFTIWTADNKCLIALSKIEECKHIHKRVVGRVLCLERIVREIIQKHGFDAVAKTIGTRGSHSLKAAIASGELKCVATLKASEDKLQSDCNGLLIP